MSEWDLLIQFLFLKAAGEDKSVDEDEFHGGNLGYEHMLAQLEEVRAFNAEAYPNEMDLGGNVRTREVGSTSNLFISLFSANSVRTEDPVVRQWDRICWELRASVSSFISQFMGKDIICPNLFIPITPFASNRPSGSTTARPNWIRG